MPPRLFCNVVYSWLVTGLDKEGREKLDRELYAPLEGWEAAQRRAFAQIGVSLPQEG